ncbi:MAG: response regulator [Rubrivivax sp.]|nr:response regulator [Rubrivivax sp.]MDP3082396.1 response regulator [Rubrivivax sp.]
MKLLVVDDEPPARAKLRRLLAQLPAVSAVIEAGDADEALSLAAQHSPEAAILDIQMPGRSGLELALDLPAAMACAFSTAFDQYAVQAFELNAVDYLLKPFTAERLAQTVLRLQQRAAAPPAPQRGALLTALQQLQPVPAHWLVPQRSGGLKRLALAEVEWVAAADNYIELHAPPACHLARHTLADFLAHANAAGFVRVHRSHAVNAAHIVAIAALPRGEAELTLRSGQRLRVSRGHRANLV